jgi:hypothetical protein
VWVAGEASKTLSYHRLTPVHVSQASPRSSLGCDVVRILSQLNITCSGPSLRVIHARSARLPPRVPSPLRARLNRLTAGARLFEPQQHACNTQLCNRLSVPNRLRLCMLKIDLRQNGQGASVLELSHHYGIIPRQMCMVTLSL